MASVTLAQVYEAIQALRTEISDNYAKKEVVDVLRADVLEIKTDIKALNNFKIYFVGVAATVGFVVSMAKDFIVGIFAKGN